MSLAAMAHLLLTTLLLAAQAQDLFLAPQIDASKTAARQDLAPKFTVHFKCGHQQWILELECLRFHLLVYLPLVPEIPACLFSARQHLLWPICLSFCQSVSLSV